MGALRTLYYDAFRIDLIYTDVVSEANDSNQMAVQIGGAEAYLGRECKTACADAGYWIPAKLQS